MQERTEMLRHYHLAPGTADEFVAWWTANIVPLRAAAGFRIEWARLDREQGTFTWLLTHPGDQAAFREAEAIYAALPQRGAAIAIAPPLISQEFGYPERVV